MFGTIKDTHTTIYADSEKIPIFFEWVKGNYYPFVIDIANEKLLLNKLIKIDGIGLEEYLSRVNKYLLFDNEEKKKIEMSRSLSDASLIKFISKSEANEIEYTFENGKSIKIKPISKDKSIVQKSIYWIKGNEFLSNKQNYYLFTKRDTFYLKYSRCKEDEKYPFKKLFDDIKGQFECNPTKIIVDMRNNQGGIQICSIQ